MKTITSILLFSFLIVFSGCSKKQEELPEQTENGEQTVQKVTPPITDAELKTELENVAACFRDSVVILQNEPAEVDKQVEDIGHFLADAKQKYANSTNQPSDGNFAKLRWETDGANLIVSDGRRIRCRITNECHDVGDGWAADIRDYEFYVTEDGPTATRTVTLQFGKSPEDTYE